MLEDKNASVVSMVLIRDGERGSTISLKNTSMGFSQRNFRIFEFRHFFQHAKNAGLSGCFAAKSIFIFGCVFTGGYCQCYFKIELVERVQFFMVDRGS